MNLASIIMLMGGGASADAGYTYLTQNAKAFWDFTLQSGSDGSTMTLAPDQTINGRDLDNSSPAVAPKVDTIQIGDEIVKTLQTRTSLSADVMLLEAASYANDMFRTDYEIDIAFTLEDGQDTGFQHIIGLTNGAGNLIQLRTLNGSGSVGALGFLHYANAQQAIIFKDLVFPAGAVGLTVVNVKVDFTNDVLEMRINGNGSGMTILAPISNITTPSGFTAGTVKMAIGGLNNAGTIETTNSSYVNILKMAVTPIKTTQQRLDVLNYFSNP